MRDLKIYISVGSIALIIYLVAQFNKPKELSWAQTLSNTDKIPFGTYILYHQLNDFFPKAKVLTYREPVYNVITDHGIDSAAYIIIGNEIKLNENDCDKLIEFVKKGNNVLLSAGYFGTYLTKTLKFSTGWGRQPDGLYNLRFLNPRMDTTKLYSLDKDVRINYFDEIDSVTTYAISENSYHSLTFIKFSLGKGKLFLNTTPLMFSNYSMLQAQGCAYAAAALSHLKASKNIIWDEYYTRGRDDEESVFRVFLRNGYLKSALYLALFSLSIFVIYEAKRRQRVIPVADPLKNSTLEFVNVVGQVYYEQRNNANIAQKKVSYFLEHIRAAYNLKTNALDQELVIALAQKTGKEIAFVQDLINQCVIIRSGVSITDKELIAFNRNIEKFNSQSA